MTIKSRKYKIDLQLFAGTAAPTLQEMLQDRAGQITQQRALLDKAKSEKRDFTAEEETEFESFEARIVALDKQIIREEAVASREKQLDDVTKPYRPSAAALGGNPVQPTKKTMADSPALVKCSMLCGSATLRVESMH